MATTSDILAFKKELTEFNAFGSATLISDTLGVPTYTNEFWTGKQRADGASSLHEVSYRACFKPQLPRFFIDRLSVEGDSVYDPFMGRGTTLLEAALAKRVPQGNDANPLSQMLLKPRLTPPSIEAVKKRLGEIGWKDNVACPAELLAFYHPDTLLQICSLRRYLINREAGGEIDDVDRWIRMVAINRLTGHSPGFFSVYTLPPNQAVSVERQLKINEKRKQSPTPRDVPSLILKKTKTLLKDVSSSEREALLAYGSKSVLTCGQADSTPVILDNSISLTVTSPPFLDIVDYKGDNWLRCWFGGIEVDSVKMATMGNLEAWTKAMHSVFIELSRVTKPGGYVAFEVGEVRKGTIKLEEATIKAAEESGLKAELVMINFQEFSKTAQIWGVENQTKGTNTNRIVLLRKN
jgi:hypothetical protein